jgi:hypothetical protein
MFAARDCSSQRGLRMHSYLIKSLVDTVHKSREDITQLKSDNTDLITIKGLYDLVDI